MSKKKKKTIERCERRKEDEYIYKITVCIYVHKYTYLKYSTVFFL